MAVVAGFFLAGILSMLRFSASMNRRPCRPFGTFGGLGEVNYGERQRSNITFTKRMSATAAMTNSTKRSITGYPVK
jgi:hypothetical protein